MNYVEIARTNRFAVKDAEAFATWLDSVYGLQYERQDNEFTLYMDEGVPTTRDVGDDDVEIDLMLEVSSFLIPGQIAVLEASGHEGLRYVTGYAVAVNAYGETRSVN